MKKLAILVLAIALTGCGIQRFDIRPSNTSKPAVEDSQTFWVGGIGQSEEIDAAKVCGGAANVSRIENQKTFENVALTILTLGIYAPYQARVFCTR